MSSVTYLLYSMDTIYEFISHLQLTSIFIFLYIISASKEKAMIPSVIWFA